MGVIGAGLMEAERRKKNASVSIGNNGRRQAALFTLRCRLSRLPSSLNPPEQGNTKLL